MSALEKIVKGQINAFISVLKFPAKIFHVNIDDYQRFIMRAVCEKVTKDSAYYWSYRIREKNTSNISNFDLNADYSQYGIVIQGPALEEDDFTYNTIRQYLRQYPGVNIIVSVWDDENNDWIQKVRNLNVEVVLNKKPQISGKLNVNMQIVNTFSGIEKAKSLGVRYVLKTRSDQRIYQHNALDFFKALVNEYKPINNDVTNPQKGRVITCAMNYGDMFAPFMTADFLYFGYVEDVYSLFNINLDNRNKGCWDSMVSRKKMSEDQLSPESYILQGYALNLGFKVECDVKTSWQFIKNHLISINKDMIGLYWPKYDQRLEENRRNGYFNSNEVEGQYSTYNFDFIMWLCLLENSFAYSPSFEENANYVIKEHN